MRFALVFCLLPLPVFADDCTDRARDVLSKDIFDGQPYRAETVMTFGATKTVSSFEWQSFNHSRTTVTEPAGAPNSMYYDGAYYVESAQGNWSVTSRANADDMRTQGEAMRNQMVQNLTAATCGSVEQNGVTFQSITVTVAQHPPYGSDLKTTRYYRPDGSIAAMEQTYVMADQDVKMQQTFEPVPDMALPIPTNN